MVLSFNRSKTILTSCTTAHHNTFDFTQHLFKWGALAFQYGANTNGLILKISNTSEYDLRKAKLQKLKILGWLFRVAVLNVLAVVLFPRFLQPKHLIPAFLIAPYQIFRQFAIYLITV